jgi:two-component system chemotaxis sensor kinase CheA
MDPIYSHLVPVFVAEAEDRLDEWRRSLAELRRGPATLETVERLHRAVHSITGNAAMLGISALAALARDVERATQAMRTRCGRVDAAALALLSQACDVVTGMVAIAAAGGHPVGEMGLSEGLTRLAARLDAGDTTEVR